MKKAILAFPLMLMSALTLAVPSVPAQDEKQGQEISRKLDEIIKTQREILQQLARLKEDLYVVKIRATT